MRLGLMLGYAGRKIELPVELVQEADPSRSLLCLDGRSVWV